MFLVVGDSELCSLYMVNMFVSAAAASGTELLPAPPLAYKKWSLSEQQQVTDHTPCGR